MQLNDIKNDGGVVLESYEQAHLLELNIKDTVELNRSPYFGYEACPYTLYVKNITSSSSRVEIEKMLKQLDGFIRIIISEASRSKEYCRQGWAEFDNEMAMVAGEKCLSECEYKLEVERSTRKK
jgi:glutathionyl-hydroquinone reductase